MVEIFKFILKLGFIAVEFRVICGICWCPDLPLWLLMLWRVCPEIVAKGLSSWHFSPCGRQSASSLARRHRDRSQGAELLAFHAMRQAIGELFGAHQFGWPLPLGLAACPAALAGGVPAQRG